MEGDWLRRRSVTVHQPITRTGGELDQVSQVSPVWTEEMMTEVNCLFNRRVLRRRSAGPRLHSDQNQVSDQVHVSFTNCSLFNLDDLDQSLTTTRVLRVTVDLIAQRPGNLDWAILDM